MDIRMRLRSLRAVAMRNIEAAAKEGNPIRVIVSSRKLEQIESIMRRYDELTREVESMLAANGSPLYRDAASESPYPRTESLGEGKELSARELSEMKKREFVQRHPSLGLRRVKGAIYRSSDEALAGIAYAREVVKNKWFLGLPAKAFERAILLCESTTGRVTSVSLPKEFLTRYGRALSQSHGQTKFNIAKRGGELCLIVPRMGPINVDPFCENLPTQRESCQRQ